MASATLNWGGTILLLIGFALLLGAVIYAETRKVLDTTFRGLFIAGIALMFIALLIIIGGHWSVFFPPIPAKETTTTQKKVTLTQAVPF